MKLAGEYRVPAPREQVWNVLLDPALLGRILPGCEKLEALGDDTYHATVKIQVGPLQGSFDGTITLADIVAPESYTMTFDGKGALGFVKGTGVVQLASEDGATHVTYSGDATIGGRIASVGQRLMETSARAMIKQTFDEIAPVAQSLATIPPVPAQNGDAAHPLAPPQIMKSVHRQSQIEFGMGILRHMFEDNVPEQYRLAVIFVAGALVLVLVRALLRLLGRLLSF